MRDLRREGGGLYFVEFGSFFLEGVEGVEFVVILDWGLLWSCHGGGRELVD